jgi:protein gp37
MGADTKIEWTHHTFNPWIGCVKIDPLCDNCYASNETYTRVQRGKGRELWGADAHRHVTSASNWRLPLRWNRDAAALGMKDRVFCASLADVFEDRRDLNAPREWLWELIRRCGSLEFMLLTKRPQNIAHLLPADVLPLVWLGVSAGTRAGLKRVEILMRHKPLRRFVSAEPLLEDLHFDPGGYLYQDDESEPIDLLIVGGESGHGARPMDEDWVRRLRDACAQRGVSFFYKQRIEGGRKVSLPMLDGSRWAQVP